MTSSAVSKTKSDTEGSLPGELHNVPSSSVSLPTPISTDTPGAGAALPVGSNVNEVIAAGTAETPICILVLGMAGSGKSTLVQASAFPTVIVYVMDTPRSVNPVTFMSNMLYACSIMYKYKLPFIVAMNKVDVVDNQFAVDWMTDFEIFQQALDSETSYVSNLTRSMSLVLDDFYSDLKSARNISLSQGSGLANFSKLN
ncbi:PREDICTED: GPN-loop GTPase 1-like [Priapulus caudatus]|uniref:GPN-loop GTPase n=1 Tax=Priapulus caudatus TaxID=37621 RepID=A0ABM1F931_PRICU|nr:PREDICTED: GPN-loop GTPase 1-like [Priapulus caudatus]